MNLFTVLIPAVNRGEAELKYIYSFSVFKAKTVLLSNMGRLSDPTENAD